MKASDVHDWICNCEAFSQQELHLYRILDFVSIHFCLLIWGQTRLLQLLTNDLSPQIPIGLHFDFCKYLAHSDV